MTKVGYKVIIDSTEYRLERESEFVFRGVYEMDIKYAIFAVLATFLFSVANSVYGAVNTRQIDKVRSKAVLDGTDLQIIDNFAAEAVQELVKTRDFTSIAKVRTIILSRAGSSRSSAEAQYAEQFSESTHKYISSGLKQALKLTPPDHRLKVVINLLILIDGLEDLRLADLAMELLNDDNTVIRYWAVHCITNPGITEQLNSKNAGNSKLASRIVEQLKPLIENSGREILALAAEFAAKLDFPQGQDLLLQIADVRISKYADWAVEDELVDATILKLLYSKISSAEVSNPDIARRFGQLYSYAMQRYIKNINGGNFLTGTQKRELASVLVETEDKCIGRILNKPQSTIKKAVGRSDHEVLLQQHNRLLGDETTAGQLAEKLNFDYGQKPGGGKRTAPFTLPQPPTTEASD